MRPVGYGRPGTSIVPEGQGPVVTATLTATVKIGPLSANPVWNDESGQTETVVADPVYEGAAALMPVSDTARALSVVEDPVSTRVYDVTLPASAGAGITTAHYVQVVSDPDPELVGKHLEVQAVEHGTRRFSRVLLATLVD